MQINRVLAALVVTIFGAGLFLRGMQDNPRPIVEAPRAAVASTTEKPYLTAMMQAQLAEANDEAPPANRASTVMPQFASIDIKEDQLVLGDCGLATICSEPSLQSVDQAFVRH